MQNILLVSHVRLIVFRGGVHMNMTYLQVGNYGFSLFQNLSLENVNQRIMMRTAINSHKVLLKIVI